MTSGQTLRPAGTLGKLKYFSAPPNSDYVGSNLVEGPDKNLWYVNQAKSTGAYTISKFTPAGTTSYVVPPPCSGCNSVEPTGLVSGPDGRIWFGTAASTVIGAMDTSGNVAYYPEPYPYCTVTNCDLVLGAVVGQDIWFLVESLSKSYSYGLLAGYIDTSTGATKSIGTGFERIAPSQLVMGSNENLWFGAGTQVASVASIYGGVNVFSTHPKMNVRSITSGPDGNLWFVSDGNNGQVGRMKTDGKLLSEFSLGHGEDTRQITTGGNYVWITTADAIVRITMSKAIETIKVPKAHRGCAPAGLTFGSDGALWFSSASVNRGCPDGIGTLVPGAATGVRP
jgi:streptogramin lyase